MLLNIYNVFIDSKAVLQQFLPQHGSEWCASVYALPLVSNYTASGRTGFLKRFKFLKQISHIVQQGDIENLSRPLDF